MRAVKPKDGWIAGRQVVPGRISTADRDQLCDYAGLNVRLRADIPRCQRLAQGVAFAIGVYRAESEGDRAAPRPTHQRAALVRLEKTLDLLARQLTALDDYSIERLTTPRASNGRVRAGVDWTGFHEALRWWRGAITLALRDLEHQESRGEIKDTARGLLLSMLADVFQRDARIDREERTEALAEFLLAACKSAGVKLSRRQSQASASQRLTGTTP
jgi:hypothetical protein